MRTLHAFEPAPAADLWWVGSNYPCRNDTHIGFEAERTGTGMHYTCARTALRAQQRDDIFMCECDTCYSNYSINRIAHLFVCPPDTFDEDQEIIDCEHCHEGNHPTPPRTQ